MSASIGLLEDLRAVTYCLHLPIRLYPCLSMAAPLKIGDNENQKRELLSYSS